jgi:DNA polymerase-3 subunit epsilon
VKHLVFDTETTGLLLNSAVPIKRQPKVIEVCMIMFDDDGEVVTKLDELVNPGEPIDEKITAITSITNNDLKGKPPFKAVSKSVINLIHKADVVVAHNLTFDMSMITNELERCGAKVVWPKRRICTVEQTQHLKGFNLNLGALHEHLFGSPHEGAHRAEADVMALGRCYFELIKRGEM